MHNWKNMSNFFVESSPHFSCHNNQWFLSIECLHSSIIFLNCFFVHQDSTICGWIRCIGHAVDSFLLSIFLYSFSVFLHSSIHLKLVFFHPFIQGLSSFIHSFIYSDLQMLNKDTMEKIVTQKMVN